MKIIVIFGPTASGKTDLAIKLAKKINGEIISADSRQVYKNLDIGTGKLSKKLTQGHKVQKFNEYWVVDSVKVYGFDLVNPEINFSAADFILFAETKIKAINSLGKTPIIAGGSGFYIKSLIDKPKTFNIMPNEKLRLKLNTLTLAELYKKLNKIDNEKAESLNNSDKNNPRRLIRAIEIALSKTNNNKQIKSNSEFLILGLSAENKLLYEKVDNWLEYRLKNGLFKEVEELSKKFEDKWLISLGLEYRWITKLLNKDVTKDIAIQRLKADIHRLVRVQKNWFHQFPEIKIFNITEPNWQNKLEKTVSFWYTQTNERGKFTHKS